MANPNYFLRQLAVPEPMTPVAGSLAVEAATVVPVGPVTTESAPALTVLAPAETVSVAASAPAGRHQPRQTDRNPPARASSHQNSADDRPAPARNQACCTTSRYLPGRLGSST